MLLLSWSATASASDRFYRCNQYDKEIESAVKRWWGVFDFPLAWKAQLYQESLCRSNAVSPVGAAGLAQFMPDTWRDMERRYGVQASPHQDISVDWGARYMALRMNGWKSKRPQFERWRLGLASYNAGFGNILEAQRKCDNTRMWREIKLCLHLVTGHNANETKTYVDRIERWWGELAIDEPWLMPRELRRIKDHRVIDTIVERFDVRRFFSGKSWCTYWKPWPDELPGVWASADHCHREMEYRSPPYITTDVVTRAAGEIDGVLYGYGRIKDQPRDLIEGEDIYIVGYPGGSSEPSLRRAKVYLKRNNPANADYLHADTIVIIETKEQLLYESTYESVIGGMSGGIVTSTDYEPLAVLVTQNGLTDLNGDRLPDASSDVVPLRDVWAIETQEAER